MASAVELRRLLLTDTPFLDVRAEVEFAQGTVPGAVNLPILDNGEREQVGLCYRRYGQQAAIDLGHHLVAGAIKEKRVAAWRRFADEHPRAWLYCWRGGLRSQIAQQWLAQAGVEMPRVPGGYKALRRLLIDEVEDCAARTPLILIAGRTGVAKTPLLAELDTGIDLEHWANHRGSSFGRRLTPPPGQTDFENRLAVDVLKTRERAPGRPLFLEDESRRVGACSVPLPLWRAMEQASLALVEMPLAFRVERVLEEYVVEMAAAFLERDTQRGWEDFEHYLCESLRRIRKRLGGLRAQQLEALMRAAVAAQRGGGDLDPHREWIRRLLCEYYDPMYDYQLQRNAGRIVFRGDYEAVRDWARGQVSLPAVSL